MIITVSQVNLENKTEWVFREKNDIVAIAEMPFKQTDLSFLIQYRNGKDQTLFFPSKTRNKISPPMQISENNEVVGHIAIKKERQGLINTCSHLECTNKNKIQKGYVLEETERKYLLIYEHEKLTAVVETKQSASSPCSIYINNDKLNRYIPLILYYVNTIKKSRFQKGISPKCQKENVPDFIKMIKETE